MTLNHSGGLLLRWFRDTLCRWERDRAQETGQDAYDVILSDVPEGPTSLLVLPHFSGSGTPWFDTSSRGAILGLRFADTRATIAKAILEGLCFELRVNLDLLREAGVEIEELHAVGGGARKAGRRMLLIDERGLPPDFPVIPAFSEGKYLKVKLFHVA